jgi:hypothetical protein
MDFLGKLRESQILDQTSVILGSGMGNASSHSNKNLPVILAGGGIKHRGHVVCPEEDHKRIPLCNLWLSALQWFGMETDSFNKSSGTFSEMKIPSTPSPSSAATLSGGRINSLGA